MAARVDVSPSRWQVLEPLLDVALELGPDERAAYVSAVCGDDPSLRTELECLLAECDAVSAPVDALLARPAAERFAHLVTDGDDVPPVFAQRFRITRELGRGGMATVYLAHDSQHDRDVAVKVMRRAVSPIFSSRRFLTEIRIVANLRHPHIVPLFDSGEDEDWVYFVMPYAEEGSLRRRVTEGGVLQVEAVVRLLREVADALAHAHEQGVIHRDIKPENILLSRGHAVVADFGVAKAMSVVATSGSGSTGTRGILGTPGYMSPEQAAGEPVDCRADLYALGVVAYEMLIGRRPTADELTTLLRDGATRAVNELCALRSDVPRPLASLIVQLLAPRPTDRPSVARALVTALDAPAITASGQRSLVWRTIQRTVRRPVVTASLALGVILAVMLGIVETRESGSEAFVLSPQHVVVFPLTTNSADPPGTMGEDVATVLAHEVESVAGLRAINGGDDVGSSANGNIRTVSLKERRAISRRRHAAFFLDGSLVRRGDSTVVALRLYSVAGDSTLGRSNASAGLNPTAIPTAGVDALGKLLFHLLEPGRRADASAFRGRRPTAIAAFVDGERAYRASQFEVALEHYQAAVADDSAFTLAALHGAQVATWLDEFDAAAPLAQLALSKVGTLPAHRAAFVRGLVHYLNGAADSAVSELRRAITLDSTGAEPWTALGDTYRHLLPTGTGLDSLAEDAFRRARLVDTTFTPPLYHLAELALRRGAVARADTLLDALTRENPSSSVRRPLELAIRCITGKSDVGWERAATTSAADVVTASVVLGAGAVYPKCAEGASWAVLNSPAASGDERWSALFTLQSLLAAEGRDADILALFNRPVAAALKAENLLILDATAGVDVQQRAAAIAVQLGAAYRTMNLMDLWLLGQWEASQKHRAKMSEIADAAAWRARRSHTRQDSLVADALTAYAALAGGDTVRAIQRLRALVPTASTLELVWYPWEGLGAERLLLAQLHLAGRHYAEAYRVASLIDGSHPMTYLVYARSSLRVRAEASAAMGDTAAARQYRGRLARLTQVFPSSP